MKKNIKEFVMRQYKEITDKLIQDEYMVIDDHNGMERKLYGVALLSNGYPGALIDHWCYCVNQLYISKKDGRVHISPCSIGGNVYNQDIERYNEECMTKIVHHTIF